MNSIMKSEILEHYRNDKWKPETIADYMGLTVTQVEKVIFPNGRGGTILNPVIPRPKGTQKNHRKKMYPLPAVPTQTNNMQHTEKVVKDSSTKDPKWVAAGKLAWETRKKNLIAKTGMVANYTKVVKAQNEYEEFGKEIERGHVRPEKWEEKKEISSIDPLVQHILIVRKETIEMMQLAIEGLEAAIKLLQHEQ